MSGDAEEQAKNPADYINRLILYLGENSEFGSEFRVLPAVYDKLGGTDAVHLSYRYLNETGLIDGVILGFGLNGFLTVRGWEEYSRISSGNIIGTTAFFAHQFDESSIKEAMQAFAGVCKECGYTPVDLETDTKAGRISDRIELEIKLSRFVIADLTEGNNGAYWEAGFAAGLGRKVIYTCREDFFEEAGTHFDVNHHTTIVWNPDDLSDAAERLKVCIQNTFLETG